MQKYGFVYIWRDRKCNRYYIGAHWGTENDGYICSSTWMRNSYKRRPQDFKRRILYKSDDKINTFEKEMLILNHIKEEELGKKYYNICVFSKYNKYIRKFSNEIVEKHKKTNIGRVVSDQTKEKIRQSLLGKQHTIERRINQSIAQKKLNRWNGNNNPSKIPDLLEKIIANKTGKKRTLEQKRNISEGVKNSKIKQKKNKENKNGKYK